jgi:hypothetical protein
MRDAKETLEATFMEMRWRALSLAADLDRVERLEGGRELLERDVRVGKLREALKVVIGGEGGRAERVQVIFSDRTPAPGK